jgi:hypothetical protein
MIYKITEIFNVYRRVSTINDIWNIHNIFLSGKLKWELIIETSSGVIRFISWDWS